MPRFTSIASEAETEEAVRHVGLPCIVKPADETSSADVARCHTTAEVIEHFRQIRAKRENTRGQRRFDRRLIVTKRKLTGTMAKTLLNAAAYYQRNRQRMRYDLYLANGWPIASGSVEGACKNLIRDRFERSGMRWTQETAEALLRLRALHLSSDFDRYWDFHINKDQQRLYPTWQTA